MHGLLTVGQFAVGQFTIKKNVSFGLVRLGELFFLTANCPTAKKS